MTFEDIALSGNEIVFVTPATDSHSVERLQIVPFQYLKRSNGLHLRDMIQAHIKLECAGLQCEEWDYLSLMELKALHSRLLDFQRGSGEPILMEGVEGKAQLTFSYDVTHRLVRVAGVMPANYFLDYLVSKHPSRLLKQTQLQIWFDMPVESAALSLSIAAMTSLFDALKV
jgi:hypothetical protein